MNSTPSKEEILDVIETANRTAKVTWENLIKMDLAIKQVENMHPNWTGSGELRLWHEQALIRAWVLEDALESWPKRHGLSLNRMDNYDAEGDEMLRNLPKMIESDSELSESEDESYHLLKSMQIFEQFKQQ